MSAKNTLRICADPDNMPFSNANKQGFENKIAILLAHDLNYAITFDWYKLKPGFIRHRLYKNQCDLIMGVPENHQELLTSRPYYRSGYVFASLKQRDIAIDSLDAPLLKDMQIGLHAFGSDGMNSPPAQVLAHLGLAANLQGYPIWSAAGSASTDDLVKDLLDQNLDLAIVWGPLAAYLFKPHLDKIKLEFIPQYEKPPRLPFYFSIAIGMRKDDIELHSKIEDSLNRLQNKINDILAQYHVPLQKICNIDDDSDCHKYLAGDN